MSGRLSGRAAAAALLLVAALVTGLWVAAPAGAKQGWTAPARLWGRTNGDVLAMAVDSAANGRAIAGWTHEAPSGPQQGRLFISVAPPGGGFGKPRSLRLVPIDQAFVRVAIAPSGTALIVFQDFFKLHYRIRVIRRDADGMLHAPVTISRTGEASFTPLVAALPSGGFMVAWRVSRRGPDAIEVARSTTGRPFTRPVIAAGDAISGGGLAVDASGDAAVTYVSTARRARVMLRPAGAAKFRAPITLSDGLTRSIEVRAAGDGFAVTYLQKRPIHRIGVASLTETALAMKKTYDFRLGTDGAEFDRPLVALAANGAGLLAFRESHTFAEGPISRYAIRVAERSAGGPFGDATELPTTAGNSLVNLADTAINSTGEAIVLFGDTTLMASVRPAGGAFPAPVAVGRGIEARAVMRADGHVIAIFVTPEGNAIATSTYSPS